MVLRGWDHCGSEGSTNCRESLWPMDCDTLLWLKMELLNQYQMLWVFWIHWCSFRFGRTVSHRSAQQMETWIDWVQIALWWVFCVECAWCRHAPSSCIQIIHFHCVFAHSSSLVRRVWLFDALHRYLLSTCQWSDNRNRRNRNAYTHQLKLHSMYSKFFWGSRMFGLGKSSIVWDSFVLVVQYVQFMFPS